MTTRTMRELTGNIIPLVALFVGADNIFMALLVVTLLLFAIRLPFIPSISLPVLPAIPVTLRITLMMCILRHANATSKGRATSDDNWHDNAMAQAERGGMDICESTLIRQNPLTSSL